MTTENTTGQQKTRNIVVERAFHRISHYCQEFVLTVPAGLTNEQVENMVAENVYDIPEDDPYDGWVGEFESDCDCNSRGKSVRVAGEAEGHAKAVARLVVDEEGNGEIVVEDDDSNADTVL